MFEFEPITRASSPALDAILGTAFPVGTAGFVRVIDYMGTDPAIVQAARVSYGKGTKKHREDRGLIRYLMRHAHTTPFEMASIKLHVRVPMDVWRQWIRHRTMSVNEYSTRYSIAIEDAHLTSQSQWRLQSEANRQGSSGEFLPERGAPDDRGSSPVDGAYLSARELAFHQEARAIYDQRINAGVAREQARKDLPLSTYTEAYLSINLHNLLHFLHLRIDPHAQQEIREYATVIWDRIVRVWVPTVAEAFEDYRIGAITLSAMEQRIMRGEVRAVDGLGKSDLAEFDVKLQAMGCPEHLRSAIMRGTMIERGDLAEPEPEARPDDMVECPACFGRGDPRGGPDNVGWTCVECDGENEVTRQHADSYNEFVGKQIADLGPVPPAANS